jgi:hypothetical protein
VPGVAFQHARTAGEGCFVGCFGSRKKQQEETGQSPVFSSCPAGLWLILSHLKKIKEIALQLSLI